ncbi:hypothetical protein HY495_01535 [Candidatus Woesearchaeota archaeon]|nr:hypothetical protein [Candidatus Woesearchaeota archaeon]
MFNAKKTVLLVLVLMIFSVSVFAVYTPSVSTELGDFVEKKEVTKVFDISQNIGSKSFQFTILSKLHTVKVSWVETLKSPQTHDFELFLDNKKVKTFSGVKASDSKTHVLNIDHVVLTFIVSSQGAYKAQLKVTTPGITETSFLDEYFSSSAVSQPQLLTTPLSYRFTAGGVPDFEGTVNSQPKSVQYFMIDDVPFSVGLVAVNSVSGVWKYRFQTTSGHVSASSLKESALPYYFQTNVGGTSLKEGDSGTITITDNFGNKYLFMLKVTKAEKINGFLLLTTEISGKKVFSAKVGVAAFKIPSSTDYYDFSDPNMERFVNFYNSKTGGPFIYGPMKFGSDGTSEYYFQQEYDATTETYDLWYIFGPFVGGKTISDDNKVSVPLAGVQQPASLVKPLGDIVKFNLPLAFGQDKTVPIYFVPRGFGNSPQDNPCKVMAIDQSGNLIPSDAPGSALESESICFHVLGETAFKNKYPSATVADVAVKQDLGLPGAELPGQDLDVGTPGGVEQDLSDEFGVYGDLNGDGVINKLDVDWIKKNQQKMWAEKLQGNIKNLNKLIKAMIQSWSETEANKR